jgi:hypothetical protein
MPAQKVERPSVASRKYWRAAKVFRHEGHSTSLGGQRLRDGGSGTHLNRQSVAPDRWADGYSGVAVRIHSRPRTDIRVVAPLMRSLACFGARPVGCLIGLGG